MVIAWYFIGGGGGGGNDNYPLFYQLFVMRNRHFGLNSHFLSREMLGVLILLLKDAY
jgi:hypothetical protein